MTNSEVTIVTGLWDLGRDNLSGWAHRGFETYKERFFELLKADVAMAIWIPKELEEEVWEIRSKENTIIYFKEIEDFKTWFPFFEEHDEIRKNPDWYNKAGWLSESPQAALEMYNPMMMTKMFMVNDTALMNPFNSNYFYWIDGGLTSTVGFDNFADGSVFDKISKVYPNNIVHIAYPYEPTNEIHGFDKDAFYKYCNLDPDENSVLISRGGFFGGPRKLINQYNGHYYQVLYDTINTGNIGADECLFTILAYQFPKLVRRYHIEGNGLVYPFFEKIKNLKDGEFLVNNSSEKKSNILYVLTFNSPKQFESICKSINKADTNFLEKSRNILINNSTDESTFEEYDRLCEEYGFEEIHRENLGVCGGRQFAAEHFEETDADFYMFFEDDMHLNDVSQVGNFCRNGLRKYVPDLYKTVLKIMKMEKFDFLKFSFSEFYGDNSVQWAWYNVPQDIRTKYWPEYDKLPEHGLDPNAPKTKFGVIKTYDEIPYITGEIYYSNWPQIVSRNGNKKMFLDEKWERPFEQTWMSHIFQLTKKNEIKPAILLASPVTHERFEFYEGNLRKES